MASPGGFRSFVATAANGEVAPKPAVHRLGAPPLLSSPSLDPAMGFYWYPGDGGEQSSGPRAVIVPRG